MNKYPHLYPDLDVFIAAIKAEAARRAPSALDLGDDRGAPPAANSGGSRVRAEPFYELLTATHVRDLLPLHGPEFVRAVFRTLLKRDPEPAALSNYVTLMAVGQRSRWEVLLSVFLAPEARRKRGRIRGIWFLLGITAVYRIPVVGWSVARLADILRMPPYLRDLSDSDRISLSIINALRY